MKHTSKITLLIISIVLVVFACSPVHAQQMAGSQVALQNPLATTNIKVLVGNGIKVVLGVMGSLALAAFVFGGYMWLTSAGNGDKVRKGTETVMYATVGLFIIFGAYAILNLILKGVAK